MKFRIIVPYFPKVSDETRKALKTIKFDTIKLDNGLGYWRLMKSIWEKPENIILIEHDVIVTPEQIQALIDCPEPYCGYGYTPEDTAVQWGCCKITKKQMQKIPDVWDKMLLRNWRDVFNHYGKYYGIGHQHQPNVINTSLIR